MLLKISKHFWFFSLMASLANFIGGLLIIPSGNLRHKNKGKYLKFLVALGARDFVGS
jgi:hypothetical protein